MPTWERTGISRADGFSTSSPMSRCKHCTRWAPACRKGRNTPHICSGTPLQSRLIICPTRRHVIAYPFLCESQGYSTVNSRIRSLWPPRSDYAINEGDVPADCGWPNPPAWVSATGPNGSIGPASLADGGVNGSIVQNQRAKQTFGTCAGLYTGVAYCGSLIRMSDITDGASNTYLLGEKYLWPEGYATGTEGGDNETALMGDNGDIGRWTAESESWLTSMQDYPPYPDTPGWDSDMCFGSAHLVGVNMSFCDGAVRTINYTIDPEAHRRLGNRRDGLPIDAKKF